MVLIEPTYFNTDPTRIIDFYDGEFVIKREDFHKLESIEDSYEVFEIGENDLEE